MTSVATFESEYKNPPSEGRCEFIKEQAGQYLRAGVSGANREATAGCNIDLDGRHTAVEETNVLSQCPARTKTYQTHQDPNDFERHCQPANPPDSRQTTIIDLKTAIFMQ